MPRIGLDAFLAVDLVAQGEEAAPPLLALLLEVSHEADQAQDALAEARASYGRAPTAERLEVIRRKSMEALQVELRFNEIWKDAAVALLGTRSDG
jgi:hypothetical protein